MEFKEAQTEIEVLRQKLRYYGEKYYTDEVAEQLEKMVNLAKQMMQEIAVLDYSKVA